jgi:hypothetical protein
MASPAVARDDALIEAASLTFALIRFEEGAAHLSRMSTPPGALRIGVEAYSFAPSWRSVARDVVVEFLAGQPSPALLFPTTTRGMLAMLLLDELTGERRAWAQKTFDNQRAAVEQMVSQLGLADDARLLLEFNEEVQIVSLRGLRVWAGRFGVQVGWSITRLVGCPTAQARLMLFRSDGEQSWGGSCPIPS